MDTNTNPLIKELSDAELVAYVAQLRQQLATWDGMALPGHGRAVRAKIAGGVFRTMRLLDIAVAVKRQRQRAGTWTGPAAI